MKTVTSLFLILTAVCFAQDDYFCVRIEPDISITAKAQIENWAKVNLPQYEQNALCSWSCTYADKVDTNKKAYVWHPNIARKGCPYGPLKLTTNDIAKLVKVLPVNDQTKVSMCLSDGVNWKTKLNVTNISVVVEVTK